jgi:transposase
LQVGHDGFVLLDALAAENAPSVTYDLPMVATFRLVWSVHYERSEANIRWRSAKDLVPVGERIQSPYDPEAHYSTKRSIEWSGYKVHVTETCDEDNAHVITNVVTWEAQTQDMSSTTTIHEHLAQKALLPKEHFVDAGYTDAELLVKSLRDYGVTLTGPVRSNSSWQAREQTGYDASHFEVDWETQQVTCPQGKTSVSWRPSHDTNGSPRITAFFSRTDCSVCAVQKLCTRAKAPRRYIYFQLREEYEMLAEARKQMEDPEWRKRYQIRAGIEGTLSQGIRSFDLRRSRYIGLAKTGLQEALTAAGMNVLRVVNWLEAKPRAKTRVSRFAALAP